MNAPKQKLNCAIYTRKSHEEGLEQDYNSLDAQYDSASHYIRSQSSQGWVRVNKHYDDGGYSGGNLERPALKQLLEDVQLGLIDVIVVYKMDRLTRALLDFAQLVEIFNKHGVTFVSVTENFNTTTSMGRLTLNMLLSFAQFERELTGERIRDKFTASKKNGIWMGGTPPLGYDVDNRKLVINHQEAKTITFIFEQYLRHGSIIALVNELEERCYRTKSWTTQTGKKRQGRKIDAGVVNRILRNPVYKGIISHKGEHYPGEHEAIIPEETWESVQATHRDKKRYVPKSIDAKSDQPYLLKGIIFDQHGHAMTPSNGGKNKRRRYRYYVSTKAIKEGYSSTDIRSVSAEQVEPLVIAQLRQFFATPEIIQRTYLKAQLQEPTITLDEVRDNLKRFNDIWDQLFPMEQNRIVQLIVKRINVGLEGIDIAYRPNGIMEVYEQISESAENKLATGAPQHILNEDDTLTVPIPMSFKRHGGRKYIITPDAPPQAFMPPVEKDSILKAVGQAFEWKAMIDKGEVSSSRDLALKLKMNESYTGRVLRLTLLAPDIIEAILNGKQPKYLTLRDLMKPFSPDWNAQRETLGFSTPANLPYARELHKPNARDSIK